ncbi:MAG TPA: class I SAM-dependent methyltransferase [Firmicutes bacterium]|jgi:tRNA (cmo5U34)-methyltransferase|nr:class I SAM-dependent methyltransferase [Bacillota bacterium]
MIEKMSDFFTVRVNGYDSHMLNEVAGCKEGYQKMADLLPGTVVNLLDLGCGTGLELDEIFKIHPAMQVTGIDLTAAMLDVLKQKHPGKDMTLIQANYFDYDFGTGKFDAVLSFQTMHHFPHAKKIELYSRIYSALKPGGKYIECDYMVIEQKEEDFYFNENERIRNEQNIPAGEFYHYDTPCTIDNQLKMLRMAEFEKVEMVWRMENTTIVVAEKGGK